MAILDASKKPDDVKLRELVLHICRRSEGDAPFGATKLNKLLFLADFLAYRQLGSAITWHSYQRLPNGPAPRAILPILREMQKRGEVALGKHNYYGRIQKKAHALRDADLSRFTAAEIALVDDVIQECWGKNAKEMSLLSHGFRGWKLAEDGETIPYSVALVSFETPTKTDLEQTLALAGDIKTLAQECVSGHE
jgi:hypothetical protein